MYKNFTNRFSFSPFQIGSQLVIVEKVVGYKHIYIYIWISFEMNLISKEIRRAEHEYMNIPPPPPLPNTLAMLLTL